MIAGIRAHCGVDDGTFMSFSGLEAVENALDGLEEIHSQGLFLSSWPARAAVSTAPR